MERIYQTERLGSVSYAERKRRVAELESEGWDVYGIVEVFGQTTLRLARWSAETPDQPIPGRFCQSCGIPVGHRDVRFYQEYNRYWCAPCAVEAAQQWGGPPEDGICPACRQALNYGLPHGGPCAAVTTG